MGTVWDRTTGFLAEHLSAVAGIAPVALFLPAAIQESIAPLARQSAAAGLGINAVSLLFAILTLWGQLAIVALALDPAIGRRGATHLASRRLLPMIGIALLLLIGLMVLMLPIPIVLALYGYDMQAALNGLPAPVPPGAAGIVLLYSLALVAVLLFLGARLALVTPVVVAERLGTKAIARSFALTRGIAWKIIGMLILLMILAIVSVLAARTVFGSVLQLIAGGEGAVSVATVLTAVLVAAVTTGFTIVALVFTARLYLAANAAHAPIAPGMHAA